MRETRRFCLFVLGLVALSLGACAGASAGLVDAVLMHPSRPAALQRVELAASGSPVDVALLVEALRGPDRLVGASAAEELARLAQRGELAQEERETAMRSLLGVLGRRGNWWRFGWDQDEPQTEGFRGTVIEALAAFGSEALPELAGVLERGSPSAREDACWVGVEMLGDGTAEEQMLLSVLGKRAGELSRLDNSAGVRAACGRLDCLLDGAAVQ